jgi:hypothetical protein
MLSTLCICIVFVPVFLLQGTAKYLFSPLVGVGDRGAARQPGAVLHHGAGAVQCADAQGEIGRWSRRRHTTPAPTTPRPQPHAPRWRRPQSQLFMRIHLAFEHGFQRFRESYRNALAWALSEAKVVGGSGSAFSSSSLLFLFPQLGRDFFPQVDAGEMRLHVRAPPGTRIETTQAISPSRSHHPQARRQRQIRRHPRQHRPALQRYQHLAERFGDRRPDGRRDPDLAEMRNTPRRPA